MKTTQVRCLSCRWVATALAVALPLSINGATGCAAITAASHSGSVSTEQLRQRNAAIDALEAEALKACATKGKAEDSGLVLVTARPDGSVAVSQSQWLGSDEMKGCILSETPKAHLPAWNGPATTWIWALGTKDHPPPRPLTTVPPSYAEKQTEYLRLAQGNAGMGNDASAGPVAACAQRSLPPDSYAVVGLKLFVFPDGKVAGATPTLAEGEGKDAAFLDCVSVIPKDWRFEGFPGPAFTTIDFKFKYGINPAEK